MTAEVRGARRLLAVLAHPDDESLGFGGALAKAAAEGVETCLVTATRGERGRIRGERPGPEIAGPIRERELAAAAAELGLSAVVLLDFLDGALARAAPRALAAAIAAEVRRLRPDVVLTFGAEGSYGHPDHVAISQATTAALVAAADPSFAHAGPSSNRSATLPVHRVSKLYWLAWDAATHARYEAAIGAPLVARVDGVERRATPWADWAVTTRIDARAHWRAVWRAVNCHASQIAHYGGFRDLSDEEHRELWGGTQSFYRVYSLGDPTPDPETDLFAGLAGSATAGG